MNPIRTDLAAASPRKNELDIPMSLAERLRTQAGTLKSDASDPAPEPDDDTPVPLPEPISDMDALVRDWAKQMFIEKMLYGEEEETGIPPLSIDI